MIRSFFFLRSNGKSFGEALGGEKGGCEAVMCMGRKKVWRRMGGLWTSVANTTYFFD